MTARGGGGHCTSLYMYTHSVVSLGAERKDQSYTSEAILRFSVVNMAPLNKNLFLGEEDFDPGEMGKGVVRNFTSEVATKLKSFNWDGVKACGCVGLSLSTDNKRVEKGMFLVRGRLEDKEMTAEANKIWAETDSTVSLTIKFPAGDIFEFTEGDLASDLVPQDNVFHGFFKTVEGRPPQPVLEAEYEELGIGNFCLRMTCTLSEESTVRTGVLVKYTILLFPASKKHLLDTFELAQSAAWPGMRLTEGLLQLLPIPEKLWKCPVIPLLLPGQAGPMTSFPTAAALRHAVATMMGKTVVPETARSGPAVLNKWKRLVSNPEELRSETGAVTWPKPSQPPSAQG